VIFSTATHIKAWTMSNITSIPKLGGRPRKKIEPKRAIAKKKNENHTYFFFFFQEITSGYIFWESHPNLLKKKNDKQ
jgi:hypothetical protein